ncbi:tetratricopeptide repeat protein [Candidatus Woesearchaeota archaeon]|nr:tetratricopeptide repeat protein [Candidatus Woesearchaeota archaeon]
MKKKTIILFVSLAVIILLAGLAFGTGIIMKTGSKDFKNDVEFYRSLGNHFAEQGNYDEAIGAYESGLLLGEDENLLNNLAVLYNGQGKYDEAVAKLRRLILIDENNPSYHYDLAVNLVDKFRNSNEQSLDDLLEALKEYELVEQLSPGYSHAAENIAVLKEVLQI